MATRIRFRLWCAPSRAASILAALTIAAAVPACDGGSPTAPGGATRCGPWPNQTTSPFNLPYPTGEFYTVIQGNCTPGTHALGTRDQYAYDFDLPIGSHVIAARAGVVLELEERYADGNGNVDQSNYVLLRHDDGTSSVYFHLTQNGAMVALGQAVRQGELIARSGQTGRAGIQPHLHFGVIGASGLTIPVTFRNTAPHPDGLVQGSSYTAL